MRARLQRYSETKVLVFRRRYQGRHWDRWNSADYGTIFLRRRHRGSGTPAARRIPHLPIAAPAGSREERAEVGEVLISSELVVGELALRLGGDRDGGGRDGRGGEVRAGRGDAVPAEAFTSEVGWAMFGADPTQFRRRRIEAVTAAYREVLTAYEIY
ncbi:hypothetical protein GCM10009827_115340 [Dactylosporangium maewongense]|uniref:Uncharacterized protein n=1 Tax=Dactylosporangium maewongense TaxID=634393 RepID=A0ABP4P7C7_9ACTN